MTDWREVESKVYMGVFRRTPLVIVRGEGNRVWDDKGKCYLDFVAGWAVTSLGHCHPAIVEAVRKQVGTLIQTSNQYYTVPQLELGQLLVDNSALDRVFFANSGAEANEGAVKLARKWGKLKLNGAYEVISTLKSFHGRTLSMVAATGKPAYQKDFTPLPAGFVNIPYNDMDALENAATEKTCAILLEPIQGEGGVNIPDEEYLSNVRAFCTDHNILMMLDEVQTGVGRTGTLWAYEQFGIEPDVMSVAKGLAGGVPIGAFLSKEDVSVLAPGDHGSTFGGNPLACAAGVAVMRYILENDVPGHVRKVGAHLMDRLLGLKARHPEIADVRGRGLLAAIEFSEQKTADILARSLERGLLLNAVSPTIIRLFPALTITEGEIDEAMGILESAL
ncbi:MAG TPA: aspartate aminotransferase family protein [Chloroflexota bacterium]|nr:aspartate aminotransferase family protein [Chloroflexota bacterium]